MIVWQNGGVYQVTATSEFNGELKQQNVFDFQLLSGAPMTYQEGLDDIEEWLTLIINVLKALQATVVIWKGFSVSELNGLNNSGFVPFTADIPGTVADDPLPPGVSILTYMNTGVKRRQLRKYWGGLTETSCDASGAWLAGAAATVAGMASYFLTTQNLTNGVWVYCDGHAGVPADTIYPFTFTTTTVPAYQRRRRQGRGI